MSRDRDVAIHRDEWGTYHFVADTFESAAYGMGYAQAEDHLHDLLGHYLVVRGELSSVIGEQALTLDVEAIRWRVLDEARAAYAELEPEHAAPIAAYVDGVQRYLDDHPERVPEWAPPIEPALPLARVLYLTSSWLTSSASAALKRAGVASPLIDPQGASNQWVIQPSRTADGRTYLLGDPHLGLGSLFDRNRDGTYVLGLFQAVDVTIHAGDLTYVGYVFVGSPLSGNGHNNHCASTMTTGGPACSDVYRIVVDDADPRRYLFDGEERRITTHEVAIAVQGRTEPFVRTFEEAMVNGVAAPIVAREPGAAYAMCTSYHGSLAASVRQATAMLRAQSVAEAKDALAMCTLLPQNVLVADREGNAYYVRGGRVPVRAPGVDWRLPVDGNTAATEWQGLHPLADLVQVENPAAGWLQNCNVSPDVMVVGPDEAALRPDGYLDYVFNDFSGRQTTRGRRAVELLSNAVNVTVEDALAIALDARWVDTDEWRNALGAAAKTHTDRCAAWPPECREFIDDLLHFDGCALPDSVPALRWATWRSRLAADAASDPDAFKALAITVAKGASLSPADSALLLDGVEAAVEYLTATFGHTDMEYGAVYQVGRGEHVVPARGGTFVSRPPTAAELAGVESPDVTVPLMLAPLRVMVMGPPGSDGTCRAFHGGYALRLTVLGMDEVETYSVLLYGQSSDPESPHYADQLPLLAAGRVRKVPSTLDEIAAQTVRTTTLTR